MAPNETAAEAYQRLFIDPSGPLGKTWLSSVSTVLTTDALHRKAVSSNLPSIVQARSTYGHFRTASQMNKVPGPYWKPDPELVKYLEQEPLRLNPTPLQLPLERLQTLYSDTVGGILLVTKQFYPDGKASIPYITLVAAPSLAPLGPFSTSDPPGIAISDYWDESVLAPYNIQIGEGLHCPMLAATEGFSRAVKLPGSVDLVMDSQPLLFPLGEKVAGQITTPAGIVTCAIFLPEVCNMPLGMVWPIGISFDDLHSSIFSLRGGYSAFLRVLKALKPHITTWLKAVHAEPTRFTSPSFQFVDIQPEGFPTFDTGDYPDAITDARAFSPLVEMVSGFLWRLICDSVLSTGSPEARRVFSTFLARGETAITPASYFGAAIPGRLCPTFAYHFTVGDRWPTSPNPTEDLVKDPFTSERARDYAPLVIDLYTAVHPPLTLITKDQKSTEAHKRSTPRQSFVNLLPPSGGTSRPGPVPVTQSARLGYPPAQPAQTATLYQPAPPAQIPAANFGPPVNTGAIAANFGSTALLPAAASLYSPPAGPPPAQPAPASTPSRSLGQAFANALPAPSLQPAVIVVKKYDPLTGTILTAQGRSEASSEFLNCCRLLTHHDPNLQLTDTQMGHPLPPQANLFPREPTLHFRRNVLGQPAVANGGCIANFYNYVEALLGRRGIQVESAYSKGFFTSDRISALFSVESWAMSPQTRDLEHIPAQTLHVYGFLQSLNEYQNHATLLPANGITLLQAKNLGYLIPLLFRMIDMKSDFLTSTFDRSVLGQRLLQWSTLTDSPAIHHLWESNPRLLTFLWFSTLREALSIMHSWVKAQRFHGEHGFYSATEAVQGSPRILITANFPSHIPGQTTTLMDAFARYDLQFAARWYDAAYSPHDPTWRSLPPPDQFVYTAPIPTASPSEPRDSTSKRDRTARDSGTKRQKATLSTSASKAPVDFTCGAHLFEPIVPLPKDKPAITSILSRLQRSTRFPKMPDSHGTYDYICFHSAFPAPHNRCATSRCKNQYASPPTTRLHLDPSVEPCKSQPEAYWQPIVTFLLQEDVAKHFKPSSTLKALTPATVWP
jgi:hypothetical protein